MWLQALLTPLDLERVIAEVTPVQIALDPEDPQRYLWLDRPREVEMLGEDGLRVATSARLQWDLVGIKLPLTLRRVSVLLTPSITQREGRDVLAFSARIEEADLAAVPALIEHSLIGKINEALSAEHAQVSWDFTNTLDFTFHLPDRMLPPRTVRLFARWGAVRMTEEGVAVAASFALDADPLPAAADGDIELPRERDVREGGFAS